MSEAARRNIPITIDASGRFIIKVLKYDDQRTSCLFLYVIVIRFEGKIYPVGQMISKRHDVATISMWLLEWTQDILRQSGTPPPEVIGDCLLALLNAISYAFNGYYFETYLDNRFKLFLRTTQIKPVCFLRRDRNHLMANVFRWNIFKQNNNSKKRQFYSRVIGYSLEIESFNLLKTIMRRLFLVCLCKKSELGSSAYKAKNWLEDKMESYNYYDELYGIEDTCDIEDETGQEDGTRHDEISDNISSARDISKFILNVYNEALSESIVNDSHIDTINLNSYFLPDIANNVMQLFQQFPVWTNVMREYYLDSDTTATTTGSENYFRIMRNEYEFTRAISLNRFLLKHRPLIEGSTKLGFDHFRRIDLDKSVNQSHNVDFVEPRLSELDMELNHTANNQTRCDDADEIVDLAERFVDENFNYCPMIDNLTIGKSKMKSEIIPFLVGVLPII